MGTKTIQGIITDKTINITNKNLKIKSLDFISTCLNSVTEEKFLKIINAGKKGPYKRAGRYQESLYWHYFSAKKEQDCGYLSDVLEKAKILEENIKIVNKYTQNKKFMKEWHKNMGDIEPVKYLKHTGKMKQINFIKDLAN